MARPVQQVPLPLDERPCTLPRTVERVLVPPIKSQGIKTHLVSFIASSVAWSGVGTWVEPFVGSGVVAFNISPKRAILSDTNAHVIQFYNDLASGAVTAGDVRAFLTDAGAHLLRRGEAFYYEIRDRFNSRPSSLDFLFLNRSCFNGVIRFNKNGKFNVPFCRKPDRFRLAYVTKIVNQVSRVSQLIQTHDWQFVVAPWQDTLGALSPSDFVYADPPYVGRHTDYYSKWGAEDEKQLLDTLCAAPCGFALSTWLENRYRRNELVDRLPPGIEIRQFRHFYHVGPTEDLRNEMHEALLIPSQSCAPTVGTAAPGRSACTQ